MTCEKCDKRETCTELCTEIRRLLDRKPEGRLYSDFWMRQKEVPYDPNLFDEFLPRKVIHKVLGEQKKKHNMDNQGD